ncbi:MAG: MATE family efflux transporter, partial [Methylobacteriaceae bacterium]|nr:MATE family efflux transporter [Methylobacteriaceae bacterium]
PRTRMLLEAPVLPTLLRLAWPNVLVMLATAATGLVETWWVGHLGTDALAGMAIVFPGVMLMQMLSGGAMGGGISSAIARALGAGRREDADALLLHALVLNVALGLLCSAAVLAWGRPLYRALGGEGGALEAALVYSDIVFLGNPLLWAMMALASAIRGTGNMLLPAIVACAGVILLVPASPLLIFGWGPIPALGVAGGGVAIVIFNLAGTVALGAYLLAGRALIRFRRLPLAWRHAREILRVGAVASLSSVQTNLVIAVATALVGAHAGSGALAGFGTAARLEYLLIPLVFGFGAPLVAMVGTNIGAGRTDRALRIAWTGGALAFATTEAIGLAAAIWPEAWLHLFGRDPAMVATGSAYLRIVGPAYGLFGLGLALYFASQGAGRLLWPLAAGFARIVTALGLGWAALALTGSLAWLFGALAVAMGVYAAIIVAALRGGAWRGAASPAPTATPAATLRPAAAR